MGHESDSLLTLLDRSERWRFSRIANIPFELVLTDMHMPGMDGFDLIYHIKKTPDAQTATIMMLTSGRQMGDAIRCSQLGVAAYLLKPVRQVELREAISRVLLSKERVGETAMFTDYSLVNVKAPARSLKILLAEDSFVNQKLAIRSWPGGASGRNGYQITFSTGR